MRCGAKLRKRCSPILCLCEWFQHVIGHRHLSAGWQIQRSVVNIAVFVSRIFFPTSLFLHLCLSPAVDLHVIVYARRPARPPARPSARRRAYPPARTSAHNSYLRPYIRMHNFRKTTPTEINTVDDLQQRFTSHRWCNRRTYSSIGTALLIVPALPTVNYWATLNTGTTPLNAWQSRGGARCTVGWLRSVIGEASARLVWLENRIPIVGR